MAQSKPKANPVAAVAPAWPNLPLFLVALSLLSAASGMFETTFNNGSV